MYFAIIDSSSDISRLATVAFGESAGEIALWFAEEFKDNFEMYSDPDQALSNAEVLSQCDELCSLAQNDALGLSDIEGLSFVIEDISVEIFGVYESYEDFCEGFSRFVDDKPKYKKIVPEHSPWDEAAECDRINTLLVRASI